VKVALCLSGFPRSIEYTYPYLEKYILSELNPDIYFFGYSEIKHGLSEDIILDLLKPKDYVIREYSHQIVEEVWTAYDKTSDAVGPISTRIAHIVNSELPVSTRTGCECRLEGWCDRHRVNKSRHLHELCRNNKKYFDMWENNIGPGQPSTGHKQAKITGLNNPDRRIFNKLFLTQDPIRILSQFYNILNSNKLKIQSGVIYDLVIRARTDYFFYRKIDQSELEVDDNAVYIPSYCGENTVDHGGICDQFAYGKSDSMDIYSDLFNHIKEFNLLRGCKFHPETLNAMHINGHLSRKVIKHHYWWNLSDFTVYNSPHRSWWT